MLFLPLLEQQIYANNSHFMNCCSNGKQRRGCHHRDTCHSLQPFKTQNPRCVWAQSRLGTEESRKKSKFYMLISFQTRISIVPFVANLTEAHRHRGTPKEVIIPAVQWTNALELREPRRRRRHRRGNFTDVDIGLRMNKPTFRARSFKHRANFKTRLFRICSHDSLGLPCS